MIIIIEKKSYRIWMILEVLFWMITEKDHISLEKLRKILWEELGFGMDTKG